MGYSGESTSLLAMERELRLILTFRCAFPIVRRQALFNYIEILRYIVRNSFPLNRLMTLLTLMISNVTKNTSLPLLLSPLVGRRHTLPYLRSRPMAGNTPPGGYPAPPDKDVAYAFTAALALGIYLATLAFTVRWLLFADEGWKKRKVINWSMVFVTAFIFVLTMAYTALDLKGVMDKIRFLINEPGAQYANPMWFNICKVTSRDRWTAGTRPN